MPTSTVTRRCTSCGATVDFAEVLVSTQCSYCASKLVDSPRAAPMVDRVAPFRMPKRAAEDRLRQHLAGSFWAPEAIRKGARRGRVRAHELRGVLVPFCAYTATVRSSYRARIGLHWHRTEQVRRKGKTETRVVTETEWFSLRGSAVDEFDDYLVEASAGLDEVEARGLEPFDLGRASKFDARLLAGWEAELPSRERPHIDGHARDRIRAQVRRALASTHLPGDRRRVQHVESDIDVRSVNLVLLPVWMATYRFQGEVYRLLVNGQTGRCVGRPPVSRTKVAVAIVSGLVVLAAALWAMGVWR